MRKVLVLILGFVFLASLCWADDIIYYEDPATLHIGPGANTGLTCPPPNTGRDVALGCGADPNLIGKGHLDIYQNTGGNISSLTRPVLLIIGVPNQTHEIFNQNSISSLVSINPYTGGTEETDLTWKYGNYAAYDASGNPIGPPVGPVYGWSGAGYLGTANNLNSTAGEDAYALAELYGTGAHGEKPVVQNSNNWTNWSEAAARLGITVDPNVGFGLNVFQLFGDLGPQGLLDIHFTDAMLPRGSIAIAYGQTTSITYTGSQPTTFITSTVTIYDTPFTEAGMVRKVPEPASLGLLGTGMIALAYWLRRRARHA